MSSLLLVVVAVVAMIPDADDAAANVVDVVPVCWFGGDWCVMDGNRTIRL